MPWALLASALCECVDLSIMAASGKLILRPPGYEPGGMGCVLELWRSGNMLLQEGELLRNITPCAHGASRHCGVEQSGSSPGS